MGQIQVVVVDNSQDAAEARKLHRILPSRVRFKVSPENIGFSRACNWALDGYHGEAILLINPDARLLPGCLKRLQKTLFSSKKVGAVSCLLFWDEGHGYYLPSSYPPPSVFFHELIESLSPETFLGRLVSDHWRRHSIKVWQSVTPVRVRNLSGGLVLLKREAVRAAGGLFDPRFFLYFEDTDLFCRMRKAGFRLMVEPGAQAVHNYDQCGQGELSKKRLAMVRSRRLFMEKYGTGWRRGGRRFISVMRRFSRNSQRHPVSHSFDGPFVLDVPTDCQNDWLFEVSPNPNFIPSAGCFGKGAKMTFPESCWNMLAPGRYFGRLGSSRRSERSAQVVSWVV